LFGYLWLEATWLENNNAAIGGAVYADQATVVYANASTFTRNVAGVKGDAVGAMLPVAIDPCT
jgi:predicted outer membrane repeat protein